MIQYEDIVEVRNTSQIDRYKAKGYELIDRLKIRDVTGEEMHYIMGLPASKVIGNLKSEIQRLQSIIRLYEDNGLQPELITRINSSEENPYVKDDAISVAEHNRAEQQRQKELDELDIF